MEVELVDNSRFVGILDCVDPDDFSVVLKNTQRKVLLPKKQHKRKAMMMMVLMHLPWAILAQTESAEPFESGSTVIFKRLQLVQISADGVVNYSESAFGGAASAAGLRTDTEISGRHADHLFGRELQAASSWLDPSLDTGELEDGSRRRSSKVRQLCVVFFKFVRKNPLTLWSSF